MPSILCLLRARSLRQSQPRFTFCYLLLGFIYGFAVPILREGYFRRPSSDAVSRRAPPLRLFVAAHPKGGEEGSRPAPQIVGGTKKAEDLPAAFHASILSEKNRTKPHYQKNISEKCSRAESWITRDQVSPISIRVMTEAQLRPSIYRSSNSRFSRSSRIASIAF